MIRIIRKQIQCFFFLKKIQSQCYYGSYRELQASNKIVKLDLDFVNEIASEH